MYVDPRGPRFAAALTTVVLAVVLLTGSAWLLAAQAAVFALGGLGGLRFAPYPLLFRRFVQPRLAPAEELEPAEPVRFSQFLGLVFAALGTVGYATGITALGVAAAAAALVAAFLNAAFGVCLGCEVYLLFRRSVPRRLAAPRT
jgi:Domain of unknown function (DUF4395)